MLNKISLSSVGSFYCQTKKTMNTRKNISAEMLTV